MFKLLLIGTSGAGKSCMLMRYVDNNFTNNFYNTIGVDFVKYLNIKLENQIHILRIEKYQIIDCIMFFHYIFFK